MSAKVTVEKWVVRFRAIGLDQAAMEKWHRHLQNQQMSQRENAFAGCPVRRFLVLKKGKAPTLGSTYWRKPPLSAI